MPVKDLIEKAIAQLPDDATIEDAIEQILLAYEIEQGNLAIEDGWTMSGEQARQRLARWLK